MMIYLDVFLTFSRIGLLAFGGGYTVLPLMQEEVAVRKKWITQEEVMDYYAVGQCLPGMMGVNTAILIGHKVGGKGGAVASTFGFAAPSLVIILLIASLLQNISGLAIVQSAFAGIRVAVCALVANAIYTMAKKGIVDPVTAVIAAVTFLAVAWLEVNPILIVVSSAVIGVAISRIRGRLKSDSGVAVGADVHAATDVEADDAEATDAEADDDKAGGGKAGDDV